MTITLSDAQGRAIAAIRDWYKTRRHEQQVFRLFGYAGCGKTTITAMAMEALGLEPMAPGGLGGVLFAAFTGKAAHVLRQKGCAGASTLHSLIYRAHRDPDGHLRFERNPDSELAYAGLVVVDEVSMVDARLGTDLLAYGRRLLVLGDPGQLPPVAGAGYFTAAPPDILLTEVRRHAQDNPVIHLATRAREGKTLPPGRYGESAVVTAREVRAERIAGADQVLAGTNATRLRLTRRLRELAGRPTPEPGPGDKLVCLRNRASRGLLNGSLWIVRGLQPGSEPEIHRLTLDPEEGESGPIEVAVPRDILTGAREPDDAETVGRGKPRTDPLTYGHALTVHKAQGSQWPHVALFDEADVFGADAPRHRYTALTRASESVTVVV